jgi:hypothetical protein
VAGTPLRVIRSLLPIQVTVWPSWPFLKTRSKFRARHDTVTSAFALRRCA